MRWQIVSHDHTCNRLEDFVNNSSTASTNSTSFLSFLPIHTHSLVRLHLTQLQKLYSTLSTFFPPIIIITTITIIILTCITSFIAQVMIKVAKKLVNLHWVIFHSLYLSPHHDCPQLSWSTTIHRFHLTHMVMVLQQH